MTGLRTHKSREGAIADLEVDAMFAYVGLQPNTAVLRDCLSLDLAGKISTDGWMRSERIGVCAAGTSDANRPIERSARPAMVRAPLSQSIAI